MARRRQRTTAWALGLASLVLSAPASGQSGFLTFQFNFSNPGARSLGFAGAFVALADDATAAFANPAGLVQLLEPEVSLEGRAQTFSTEYTRRGRIDGEPSGFGIDNLAGLASGVSSQTIGGLSFASFVYPRRRWALAVYHHQFASFEFASETQGLFAVPFPPDTGFRRELDRRIRTDYDFAATGFSGAWRVTDELSLGLGAVRFELELRGTEERFSFDSLDRFFAPNSYLPGRNVENLAFTIDETDWAVTAGALWRLSRRWNLAASYREGPEAEDFAVEMRSGAADPAFPVGTLLFRITSPIEFPDVLALGAAFRSPDDRLTVSFEWDRVTYSRIIESIDFDTTASIADGDELHLGAEWVFLARRPVLALRGGLWLDPDHRLTERGSEAIERALFRGGDDELHLALGLGLAWRRLQLDLGIDLSDSVDTVSLSTIHRW